MSRTESITFMRKAGNWQKNTSSDELIKGSDI
jgi:hypothetical protein